MRTEISHDNATGSLGCSSGDLPKCAAAGGSVEIQWPAGDKFLTTVAGNDFVGTHDRAQNRPGPVEHLVASLVAKGVVILLEVVEVEHHERKRRVESIGLAEEQLQVFAESRRFLVPVNSSTVGTWISCAF